VVDRRLRAYGNGKTFGVHKVTSREHQRFKGLPDPGGMAIVYAIESLDGTRGSSADAFGVSSTPS